MIDKDLLLKEVELGNVVINKQPYFEGKPHAIIVDLDGTLYHGA